VTPKAVALSLLLVAGGPCLGWAQAALVVTAVDSTSLQPVPEALGRLVRGRRTVLADRLGRIRLGTAPRPVTVVVQAIGFRPETVAVAEGVAEIVVLLRRSPIGLAELTVGADTAFDLTPAAAGRWVLPRSAIGLVPPAIESDPFRALAALPAVSFSSPLSARPIIRGYDAAENVTRLDGFELVNPYHIGRVFAAFPADFTHSVDVSAAPHRVADGEALAGVVDLVGLTGAGDQTRDGGADFSLASVTAWHGWQAPFPGFAGARVASLALVTDIVGERVAYDFCDGYVRLAVPLPGRRRTDLTLYGSRDDLGDPDHGTGVAWSNVLVGQRTRVWDRPNAGVDAIASFNRFALRARDIEARFTRLDVTNRFQRFSVGLEAHGTAGVLVWTVGGAVARRDVDNIVRPRFGGDFPSTERSERLTERHGFASVAFPVAGATLVAGWRLDASSRATTHQPRARLTVPLARGVTGAITLSRASRLYYVITDPQPEPSLAFYDFWMTAGDSGIPTPRIDHAAAELDITRGAWVLHAGAYASRGSGLGELRPESDLRDTTAFRWGASRTAGVEVRVARGSRSPGGPSVAASYALAWSERRWEDGVWRPWRLDQRHRIRVQADAPLSARWRIFALAEARSAQPVTRVSELYFRPAVPPGDSATRPTRPGYLYAPEGSARGEPTVWLDVGTRFSFRGPWGMRTGIGFSVTNLIFGPVAPLEPVSPAEAVYPNEGLPPSGVVNGVPYRRRYSLPPAPSLTVRIEF
jgi:hypothetical protein